MATKHLLAPLIPSKWPGSSKLPMMLKRLNKTMMMTKMMGVTQAADETDAVRRDAVGGGEKMVWQARRWASQTWTSVIIRISN